MSARGCVFVVDDGDLDRAIVRRVLSELPLTILEAGSGEAVVSEVRRDKDLRIELVCVILDVQMPGLGGFDTAIELRKEIPNIPILFLTGEAVSTESAHRAYQLGAIGYIHKPVDFVVLRGKVAAYLELFEHGRRLRRERDALEWTTQRLRTATALLAEHADSVTSMLTRLEDTSLSPHEHTACIRRLWDGDEVVLTVERALARMMGTSECAAGEEVDLIELLAEVLDDRFADDSPAISGADSKRHVGDRGLLRRLFRSLVATADGVPSVHLRDDLEIEIEIDRPVREELWKALALEIEVLADRSGLDVVWAPPTWRVALDTVNSIRRIPPPPASGQP